MPRTAADAIPNELLTYEREQRHWTQEEVAGKIAGLGAEGPKTVGRWERGIIKPSPYYLRQLAMLYGRSVEELGYTKGDRIPFFHVPYIRNPFFTGREDMLARLHEMLALHKSKTPYLITLALIGLGGVGKTQIAIEYAYRSIHKYHTVIWLRADSAEVLASDFAAIATLLNLPIQHEQDQRRIIEAVKDWLTHMNRWLLIFDNADHPERVYDFLPSPCYGHILLTTRSHATATYAQPIEIGEMTPDEGTYFLLRRAKVIGLETSAMEVCEGDSHDAQGITEELGGLPLALEQAGAYIEETGCTLSRYAALYQTHRDILLQYRGEVSREYPHSVATTWSLAFESIRSANPIADKLVHLFAFLAPDAIPEEILKGASVLSPLLQPLALNPLALDLALKELLRYSLLRRNAAIRMFSMHRLVQAVLKDRLDEHTQRFWAECVVKAVNHIFPDVQATTWSTCQRYLSQAQMCADLIEQWDMQFIEAERLLYQTGCYLRDRAQYKQAEALLKRTLALQEELRGPKHPEVATTIDSLASTYFEQGKYLQAESLYQQALTIREQAFGTEHPEVAKSLNDLAHLRYFIHENTYDEAEQMFRRALLIRERALGKDHPDVALTLQTFGHLYNYQGKYEQALALYQQALEIRERVLGSDHPDLVDLLMSMGHNYHRMGKDDQAEDLYQRAIVISEAVAPEHPQLGLLLDNKGIISMSRGIYDQAEQYFKRSLAIHEKALGLVHPHIAKCLDNFALLYSLLARYDQAEALAKRALAIHEQTVGPEHTDCTIVLSTLANIYLAQGKYAQTSPVLQRTLMILQKDQRPSNPFLADTYVQSAQLAFSEKRYSEAEILFQKGLVMFEGIFGEEHPEVAETLLKIAKLFIVQGKYTQAELLCTRALALWEKKLGSSHINIAQGLTTQALLFSKQGKYGEAETLCTRAGVIYVEALGPSHPHVASCLSILAGVYQDQGDYTGAKSLYERALEIWEQKVLPEHIDVIACKERYSVLLHTLTEERETQAQEK